MCVLVILFVGNWGAWDIGTDMTYCSFSDRGACQHEATGAHIADREPG